MANQFSVIDHRFCASDFVNLRINTKKGGSTYDINNNRIFYIKEASLALHDRRVLYDGQGKPIVTLYYKNMTMHGRCKVFRGKSSDSSQLLFSVKRSSMFQCGRIKLEVFLAKNTSESECDFRVNVSKGKTSCTVFVGESPHIVATMENDDGYNVRVNPYVDHAFIITLLMIVHEKTDYGELLDDVDEIADAFVLGGIGVN